MIAIIISYPRRKAGKCVRYSPYFVCVLTHNSHLQKQIIMQATRMMSFYLIILIKLPYYLDNDDPLISAVFELHCIITDEEI